MRCWLGGIVIVNLLVGFGLGYVAGKHSDDTRVPNLLGLGTQNGGQAAASELLAAAGLRVGKVVKRLCTGRERACGGPEHAGRNDGPEELDREHLNRRRPDASDRDLRGSIR